MSKKSAPKRYDPETGALANQTLPPTTSASDYKRFLKNPKEDADHPFAYIPGIYLISGPLGSGKSSLIFSLLDELSEIMNPKTIGRVMYFSGSGTDKLLEIYKDSGMEMYDGKSKESFQSALLELLSEEVPHEEKKMNIVVLDDAINDPDLVPKSVQSHTPLSKILMSARHIPCCVILSSQKFNAFPTFSRANASHIFAFRTKSPAEQASIIKDAAFSKKEIEDSMSSLTDPVSFIHMNNLRRTITKNLTVPLIH